MLLLACCCWFLYQPIYARINSVLRSSQMAPKTRNSKRCYSILAAVLKAAPVMSHIYGENINPLNLTTTANLDTCCVVNKHAI